MLKRQNVTAQFIFKMLQSFDASICSLSVFQPFQFSRTAVPNLFCAHAPLNKRKIKLVYIPRGF